MTMTRIPAMRHSLMASMTSLRGGSSIPTKPTNVQFVCIVIRQSQLSENEFKILRKDSGKLMCCDVT